MSGQEICWYFQRNSCRFGSNCRNLHVYGAPQQQVRDTRRKTVTFKDQAPEQPSGVSVLQRNRYVVNNAPKDSVLTQHMEEVSNDIAASDSMWPASCYSYLQTHGNLQGFEDFSPEEMRLKAYSNPQEYMHDINNLKTNVAELKKSFLNKTQTAQEILNDYMKQGPSRAKQFLQPSTGFISSMDNSSNFFSGNQNTPSSGFFSPSQNTGSFSLNNNPAFRGQPQTTFSSNIFAQALHEEKPSPFGQRTSVFGEPIEDNAFKQNIFGSVLQSKSNDNNITAAQASQSSSQFSFSNAFSNSAAKSDLSTKVSGKCVMYSQENELTPEELEQFKATTFTYGKTPLKCPPKELC
ncbi:nucleoporin NUP42 [Halyomorpha halys]|uniref:nucleoporin NUP42 n=1 Tax=Halyomorpha halys TaxID=286706 RepID=UPI0006D4E79E|nr:nucleoporin-like protein 2 [Halyomorpha halys]